MDALIQQVESPFKAGILHFPLPTKFRMSQIETFNETKYFVDHLNTYINQMELHEYQDPVRCRAFVITLKGSALAWFNKLPSSSVSSFRDLSIAFVYHFIKAWIYRKPSYHLLTRKHSPPENMRSYVQRFNAESLKVYSPDDKFSIIAFNAGLGVQSKDLMLSILKASMANVLAKVEKYTTVRKPFYLSGKALPCKRRKVEVRKRENEAPGDDEAGIDPHEGTGKIENDLQKDEVTLGTT